MCEDYHGLSAAAKAQLRTQARKKTVQAQAREFLKYNQVPRRDVVGNAAELNPADAGVLVAWQPKSCSAEIVADALVRNQGACWTDMMYAARLASSAARRKHDQEEQTAKEELRQWSQDVPVGAVGVASRQGHVSAIALRKVPAPFSTYHFFAPSKDVAQFLFERMPGKVKQAVEVLWSNRTAIIKSSLCDDFGDIPQ